MIKKFCFINFIVFNLFFSFTYCFNNAVSFEGQWGRAQQEYKVITANSDEHSYNNYCHSFWTKSRKELEKLICGEPNKKFLAHTIVSSTMVWKQEPEIKEWKKIYLKDCISKKTKNKLLKFKDVEPAFLPHECEFFDCSYNSLVHLFYAAKSLEAIGEKKLETIMEFGGGYGNLCRIFKMVEPESTIFIIDLPESLFLQAIFLRTTLPGLQVIVHSDVPKTFETGAIHLIPVHLIEDIDLDVDLFISTLALSETTPYLQNLVGRKKFFGADVCYIVGQLYGWGVLEFESHDIAHALLRDCYPEVYIQPFHIFWKAGLRSYESLSKK